MGCIQSCAGNKGKSDAFCKLVLQRHPLAVALDAHWSAFIQENEFRRARNVSDADRLLQVRKSTVMVHASNGRASSNSLTFTNVKHVAELFLGHAMYTLERKNLGGSIKYKLNGVVGQEGKMDVTGALNYNDGRIAHKVPYNVLFKFPLAAQK